MCGALHLDVPGRWLSTMRGAARTPQIHALAAALCTGCGLKRLLAPQQGARWGKAGTVSERELSQETQASCPCRTQVPAFPWRGTGKAVCPKCTHPRPSEPSESEMSTVVRSRFSIFTHSSMRRLTAVHAPAGLVKLRNKCWQKRGSCTFPVAAPNRASHVLWIGALPSQRGVFH